MSGGAHCRMRIGDGSISFGNRSKALLPFILEPGNHLIFLPSLEISSLYSGSFRFWSLDVLVRLSTRHISSPFVHCQPARLRLMSHRSPPITSDHLQCLSPAYAHLLRFLTTHPEGRLLSVLFVVVNCVAVPDK